MEICFQAHTRHRKHGCLVHLEKHLQSCGIETSVRPNPTVASSPWSKITKTPECLHRHLCTVVSDLSQSSSPSTPPTLSPLSSLLDVRTCVGRCMGAQLNRSFSTWPRARHICLTLLRMLQEGGLGQGGVPVTPWQGGGTSLNGCRTSSRADKLV